MEKLLIEISLGNVGMRTANDAIVGITAALATQAPELELPMERHWKGTIRDDNGNSTGTWEVVEA